MKALRETQKLILEVCEQFEGVTCEFGYGSAHPFANISLPNGKHFKFWLSKTPSDHRALKNNLTGIRKRIKLLLNT